MVAKENEQSDSDEIVGLWTALPIEELIPYIVQHIRCHLDDLEAGLFDHCYPAEVINRLIEYNRELIESFQSGVGNMSLEAVVALYQAYQNEEDDLTAKYHPKELTEALGQLAAVGFYITSRQEPVD